MDLFHYLIIFASITIKVGLQLAILILLDIDQIINAKLIKILSKIAIGILGIAFCHVLVSIRSLDNSFYYILLGYIIVT